MLRSRTVNEQILPVLRYIRENVDRGSSVVGACQAAIRIRHKEINVTYQTLEDGCRRRLGLERVAEFHALVAAWIENRSGALKDVLLRNSEALAHSDIEEFFGDLYLQKNRPVVTTERLDPETLALLGERARMNGRSVEAEITALLTRAARSDRGDFAKWAAELRNRLRERYVGDVTADIRSERQR